jgi:hypothetical protein
MSYWNTRMNYEQVAKENWKEKYSVSMRPFMHQTMDYQANAYVLDFLYICIYNDCILLYR